MSKSDPKTNCLFTSDWWKESSVCIKQEDPIHIRVAKRSFAKKTGRSVRTKTAGEIRYPHLDKMLESGSGDAAQREIPRDFVYDKKYLKPLSKTVWSLSVAMGHLISAKDRFTKIRSINISPDGKLGGKGYIQNVRDLRSGLADAIEVLSNTIDTISDEVDADHWREQKEQLSDSDKEEVDELNEEAEDIISDPEGFADEAEGFDDDDLD